MSETNSYDPNRAPRHESYTELPVEVSPEQAQEVGNYFTQILEEHGKPADIAIMSRAFRVHKWKAERAEFTTGDRKLIVEKMTDPILVDKYPETVATIFERNKESKSGWEKGDIFTYNRKNNGALDYRRGNTLLYARDERPLKPGVEGVQHNPRWRHLTVNVTPPTPEGVVDTLGMFLQEADQIIEKSHRPKERVRALGHRVVDLARKI